MTKSWFVKLNLKMSYKGSVWLSSLLGLGLLSVIILRVLFVVIRTIKKLRQREKRSAQDNVKTVIVIGSGGHTSEMMYLIESLHPVRYSPRIYVMASSDSWSEQKILDYENNLKGKGTDSKYEVIKIPRSRSVHQSYLTSVFTTLYSTLYTVPIMLKFNPDIILCNGPGTCIPVCAIGFLMRCFFISNNTIIFVESICRVTSLSLTGKILQWFADEIFVQWPELSLKCKRSKYIGRIV